MIADKIAGGIVATASQADEGVRDSSGAGGAACRFVRDAEKRKRGVGERAGKSFGVALRIRRVAERVRGKIARVGDDQAFEGFGDQACARGRPGESRERGLARRWLSREHGHDRFVPPLETHFGE
mgnify:FL=1